MNHIEHDGGRLGFAPNEKLDCTVRALAIAAEIPFLFSSKTAALFHAQTINESKKGE